MSTREELQAQARAYITECLAKGITEIEQPAGLWAEVREVYGPRATIFSAAGWDWLRETVGTDQRARAVGEDV